MKIGPLADHLDLVEIIGRWHWNEWGYFDPAGSRESWIEGASQETRSNAIPTTLVALSLIDQPLGYVSLVDCDMNNPGFRLHKLKGKKPVRWSIWVNGNWRLTFEFEDGNAYVANYEDYH